MKETSCNLLDLEGIQNSIFNEKGSYLNFNKREIKMRQVSTRLGQPGYYEPFKLFLENRGKQIKRGNIWRKDIGKVAMMQAEVF